MRKELSDLDMLKTDQKRLTSARQCIRKLEAIVWLQNSCKSRQINYQKILYDGFFESFIGGEIYTESSSCKISRRSKNKFNLYQSIEETNKSTNEYSDSLKMNRYMINNYIKYLKR